MAVRLGSSMRAVLALAIALSACGSSERARSSTADSVGDEAEAAAQPEGAAPPPPVRLSGGPCPPDLATPDCGMLDVGTCVRADGAVCGCATEAWCGGAAAPPLPPAVWTCDAPSPCGPVGSPCASTSVCPTGPCSWMGAIRCTGGIWTEDPAGPAPP